MSFESKLNCKYIKPNEALSCFAVFCWTSCPLLVDRKKKWRSLDSNSSETGYGLLALDKSSIWPGAYKDYSICNSCSQLLSIVWKKNCCFEWLQKWCPRKSFCLLYKSFLSVSSECMAHRWGRSVSTLVKILQVYMKQ